MALKGPREGGGSGRARGGRGGGSEVGRRRRLTGKKQRSTRRSIAGLCQVAGLCHISLMKRGESYGRRVGCGGREEAESVLLIFSRALTQGREVRASNVRPNGHDAADVNK